MTGRWADGVEEEAELSKVPLNGSWMWHATWD